MPQQAHHHAVNPETRLKMLRRAQVWTQTDVRQMDIKAGPPERDAFAPGATVPCEYRDRKLDGRTPKFECAIAADDEVKVKYGLLNGEVYGEVAATRLLWALGFGADRMYPVRIVCPGCPASLLGGVPDATGNVVFDPAVLERKAAGREIATVAQSGWTWQELDLVDEAAGGAPLAQRDALKLLGVLLQHTDSKSVQQRLVCLDKVEKSDKVEKGEKDVDSESLDNCAHPFMMVNDLGLTFGRSDFFNRNTKGSVNFERWSQAPIWRDADGCVGNLPRSMTGTLNDPVISEAGRAFLAGLLNQLSDTQLHDLFDVARVTLRPAAPDAKLSPSVGIDRWVSAFKHKREEISSRRCVATR